MADTDYLAASDGTGDAALMHVTTPRTAGATIIQVDTVSGVPAFFIGTWGTLLASGFIDPTTKRDFFGHVNAGTLVIDKMAPGNTDAGNTTGQVVVIKPSTPAQNTVSAAIKAGTTFPAQFTNFVEQGGGVWTINSGLIGQMSAGFVWYNGARTAISAIATHTFGANLDTYVDINPATGVATYVPVANGVDEPAVTASSVRVAKVVTGASITLITYNNYTDPRRYSETFLNYIAGGCVWSADAAGSTLLATMTPGVVYINGKRLTVAGVTSRAFSASVDTYVDFQDNGDGTAKIVYTTAVNNAASPAIPNSLNEPNNVRNAIIVSGATNILNTGSINQGQENKVLPIASSVAYTTTDSLGNLICPRDPNRKILGYRQIVANSNTTVAGNPGVAVTGLNVPVVVPLGRKVRVHLFYGNIANNGTNNQVGAAIWDGQVTSGTELNRSVIFGITSSSSYETMMFVEVMHTPTVASKNYTASLFSIGGGTTSLVASAATPSFIMVELA